MSASLGATGGIQGLVGLFPTLQPLGAMLLDPVSISRAGSRLDPAGNAIDPDVHQRVEFAMDDLRAAMDTTVGVVSTGPAAARRQRVGLALLRP